MNCELCKSRYGWFGKKQTSCKRCSKQVCTQCIKQDQQVVIDKQLKLIHICLKCFEDVSEIKSAIQNNMCSWNYNSKMVGVWIADMEKKSLDVEINSELASQIKQELTQVRFNYSMGEFIYHLQRRVENPFQTVNSVLQAFCSENPDVGFNSNLLKISLFLLCFAKDYIVAQLLTKLYQKIPKQYHPKYQASPEFIADWEWQIIQLLRMILDAIQDFQQRFKANQQQMIVCKEFIEHHQVYYKSQLFLNLNFSCAFHIISSILIKDFREADKYFSVIMKLNHRYLTHPSWESLIQNNTFVQDLKSYQNSNIQRSSIFTQQSAQNIQKSPNSTGSIVLRTSNHRSTMYCKTVTDFDDDSKSDLNGSTTMVQSQQEEILQLNDVLRQLEIEIKKYEQENEYLRKQQSNKQDTQLKNIMISYEQLMSQLIDESEAILSSVLKD